MDTAAGRAPTSPVRRWAAWLRWHWRSAGASAPARAMATVGGWEKGGDLGLRLVARTYGFFHRVTRLMARDPLAGAGARACGVSSTGITSLAPSAWTQPTRRT